MADDPGAEGSRFVSKSDVDGLATDIPAYADTTPPVPAAPAGPRGGTSSPPEWIRQPSEAEFNAAFPKAALRDGVSGKVVLKCETSADTRLKDCKVQSETPVGYGYGGAALGLSRTMRVKPAQWNGETVTGVLDIPVSFQVLPPEPMPRPEPRALPPPVISTPPVSSPDAALAETREPPPRLPQPHINPEIEAAFIFGGVLLALLALAFAYVPKPPQRGRFY